MPRLLEIAGSERWNLRFHGFAGDLVKLTYVQACKLPARQVVFREFWRGSKRHGFRKVRQWFATADAVLACPHSTRRMQVQARDLILNRMPAP